MSESEKPEVTLIVYDKDEYAQVSEEDLEEFRRKLRDRDSS